MNSNPSEPLTAQTVSLSHASLFIPIFEGKETPGSVALEDFLQALRMVKTLGLFQDQQVLNLAALRLKGPAREFIRICPELLLGTLQEFVDAFRKRFGEKKDPASALSELLSIEQKPAEKVYDFAQRVKLLLDAFFLGNKIKTDSEVAKVITNEVARMTFARGLQPAIRRAVLSKKTTTLESTIEAARDEELNLSIGTLTETSIAAIREVGRESEDATLREEVEKLRHQLVLALTASELHQGRPSEEMNQRRDQLECSRDRSSLPQERRSQHTNSRQTCGAADHHSECGPYVPVQICHDCRNRDRTHRGSRSPSQGRSSRREHSPWRSNPPPRYSPAPQRRGEFDRSRETRYRESSPSQWRETREYYRRPHTQRFPKNGDRAPRR